MSKTWDARIRILALASLLIGMAGVALGQSPEDALERGFENPPDSAKPRVWWHWMNGNITKEGIKLDLDRRAEQHLSAGSRCAQFEPTDYRRRQEGSNFTPADPFDLGGTRLQDIPGTRDEVIAAGQLSGEKGWCPVPR